MTWTEDLGTEVTSAFLGITTPLRELSEELTRHGWSLGKVEYNNGSFEATGVNLHGEETIGRGNNENTAVGNLLMRVMRREFMRQPRTAAWGSSWSDKLPEIAEAYAKAPVYDPNAAPAWRELAQDSIRRAKILQTQLQIEVVDDPHPYANVQEMCDDVHRNRHIFVSRTHADHPVWSVDESVAFRLVHDVLGHCAAGSEFGWHGENQACAAHFPLLTPTAQQALFTECIGSTAYGSYYRSQSPQKIAFLSEYFEDAQNEENGPAHVGVHPSQSVVPAETPRVEGLAPVTSHEVEPGHFTDPNLGWGSGYDALPDNGFMWHGDPLQAHAEGGLMDAASKVDTGWHGFSHGDGSPDFESMKQAVANAFRASLLAPRKGVQWNAIHYQDLMHLPAGVDDPKRYYDTLESKREGWNQARGFAPESHKLYWQAQKQFEAYVAAMSPDLTPHEAKELADREFLHLWVDEEERLAGDPKHEKLSADELEQKVAQELDRRLLTMLKPESKDTDVAHHRMHVVASDTSGKYGSWMTSHLKAIANVASHSDELLEAALTDVREHNGAGHHFRAAVLGLGLPGVGPKVASFAWYLLQPQTSQLASLDRHALEALGRNYDTEMNDRDYFKFERELAAGRDTSGHGHIPLGAFTQGLRDLRQGVREDHSGVRVLHPTDHSLIDWESKPQGEGQWEDPEWWANTAPARQQVADDWDESVASRFPRGKLPVFRKQAAEEPKDEFCVAFIVPDEVRNSIANWASTLDWPEGFELDEPDDYHITVMYAPHGWDDAGHHEWIRSFPLVGLPATVTGLELFGPDKDTVVVRLESDELDRWANRIMDQGDERGLEVSRFPGGYKPHITIGTATSLPEGDDLNLRFRTGPVFLYNPRPLQDKEPFDVLAAVGRVPWHVSPEGDTIDGQPGQSLMHHLRQHYGLPTRELWKMPFEVGKR